MRKQTGSNRRNSHSKSVLLLAAVCAAAVVLILALAGCGRKVNVSAVNICGVPLKDLRIAADLSGSTEAAQAEKAEALRAHVNMLLTAAGGTALEPAGSAIDGSPALVFTENASCGYDDYVVRLGSAGQVSFEGGSEWALKMAFGAFLEAYVLNGKGVDTAAAAAEGIQPGDPLLDYTAPDRDAYINDPSLLPLHWLGEWTPPAKMLDYGTKVACLVAPDGHSLMELA